MRVIATAIGYDSTSCLMRQVGDEFDCPKNPKGEDIVKSTWYVPAEEYEEPTFQVGPKGARPEGKSRTLSMAGKHQARTSDSDHS